MKNALMLRVMWMCGFLVALACRVTLAAAPVKRTSPTPHNAVKPSKPTTNTPRTSSAKPTNPFAHLKPLNSGPGIIVCEPISTTGNAAFGAFGVGCGRWLHVTVGGQGELGKTPLFPYIAYAEHEKQWPNLRLSPENALEIANMLGATHVATGHIEGTPAKCELAYQLWEATGGGEIGTPIVAAGSQADIVAALPRIARELAVRLGVANPFIPPAVNVTPTELTGIGYIPLGSPFVLQPDWKQQLLAKAGECPLAGLIIIESKEVTPEVVGRVLAPSVDNVVILGEIGVAKPTLLQPYDTQINQLVQKFPYNYQLATIDGLRKRSQENRKAEIAAMELAVLCSPGNSWAWIYLGDALSNQAEDIRKSRIAGQITDAEWASLNKLYPLWQAAETRATQLDKLNSWAWADLATAATFNSNSRIADAALWKALELNPYNASTYSWGLQMYQPKWDDDPAKLLKVAEAAAKQRFLTPTLAYEVVDVLQNFTEVTDHTQQIIMLALGQLLGSNLTDPRSSGPGVLICEPVAAQSTGVKADANTTKFGIGCGRWLHFTVGGLPEFGKTPLWHDVDEARRFLKFPDLRLSAAQATRLATALGATHIATGRIEGTAQHCNLIYRLYHL
ncbi:MAG: hypothetical protein JOZ57_16005 [Abitibacteriaceae bacterium]|nr:hypothetical protein [Abditibacteriaceae bacterium]